MDEVTSSKRQKKRDAAWAILLRKKNATRIAIMLDRYLKPTRLTDREARIASIIYSMGALDAAEELGHE